MGMQEKNYENITLILSVSWNVDRISLLPTLRMEKKEENIADTYFHKSTELFESIASVHGWW